MSMVMPLGGRVLWWWWGLAMVPPPLGCRPFRPAPTTALEWPPHLQGLVLVLGFPGRHSSGSSSSGGGGSSRLLQLCPETLDLTFGLVRSPAGLVGPLHLLPQLDPRLLELDKQSVHLCL